MAWVHSEVASFTYTVKDDDGAKSTMTFYGELPSLNQWTQDAMNRIMEELWDLINPLIDAALIGCVASIGSYEDTYPSPADGSDVEDKGVFLFTAEGNQKGSVALASILEAKLVDTGLGKGIQINFDDVDVAAFNTAMLTGIYLNPFGILDTVRFGTSRGEDWEVTRDGYKQNRKSQKSRGYRG